MKPTELHLFCSGESTYGYAKTSFAYLPSAGIWADREETDDELLNNIAWSELDETD